jgi:aminomethyltransferase
MAESLDTALKTPLFDLHTELGGRLVPFAGYALPVQFPDGIMAEHVWTRQSAGLFDVSHMGQVTLCGDTVDAALEALIPGDIKILKPGKMRYSLLLDDTGGILDDLMVTRTHKGLFLVVNGAVKQSDILHMRGKLPKDIWLDYHADAALLALQGPKAVDALVRIAPDAAKLTFMTGAEMTIADVTGWVSRSGYTGEDGFEIAVSGKDALHVAHEILKQPEVKPIGLGARDSLRLEAGLPLYGHDITTQTNPVEADLAFAISKRRKTEMGFPGAGNIMDQLLNGAATKRVGLKLDGRQPAREGAEVYRGDAKIGTITSGGFSPTLQMPIAMGYVRTEFAKDGTSVEIDVRGKRLAATVAPMPFVPHNYVRSTS